ncbi:DUF898 domain-containing protein [Vibrio sp. Of7-15]|uniref:YjgN family protein n=1 Tax=Vibrio sp. Of7-15 TaxID=2724879 RepID=UPI001EF2DD99|nr:YjgN family protein [Vibrio sp. Of7-15]MCG7498124.1 DUF898 domain-containing protein [Vibrio sp. Of7-15]
MDNNKLDHTMSFTGRGGEFFGIWIVNILLSVITLGIYSAWAKVRTNQYFYGNTILDGDSFEYHAKPMQILKGRLVALVCVLLWAVANSLFPVFSMVLLLAFVAVLPFLSWSNARFDSAMTSYRNVRFSFVGTLGKAYSTILGRSLVIMLAIFAVFAVIGFAVQASPIAAGIVILAGIPGVLYLQAWAMSGIASYFANGYRYGERDFSAQISSGYYFKTYLLAAVLWLVASVLSIVAIGLFLGAGAFMAALSEGQAGMADIMGSPAMIGIAIAAYAVMLFLGVAISAFISVRIRNHVFSQLMLEGEPELKCDSKMTVMSYVGLVVTNFILQVITMGIARPWVMVRTAKYVASVTSVHGDLSRLVAQDQDSNVKSAVSDEVAQAFDVNLGIG